MQSTKAAYSDPLKRSNCQSELKWNLSRARLRILKIVMPVWTEFTQSWANATNRANVIWPRAIMNTSHDGFFGHGWVIGRLG
jgi:hypothetical protein